jgi:hypothetical protein
VTRRPWRTAGSVELLVSAPPEAVYDLVSDVTRIGERSVECHAAGWLDGASPRTVGAVFRGRNRAGLLARWARRCEVLEADTGRAFVFRTLPERDPTRRDSTTWGYRIEPADGRSRVTHFYEITRLPLRPFRALFGLLLPDHRDMRPQMRRNLEALRDQLSRAPH